MEIKWTMIAVAVMVVSGLTVNGTANHYRTECRIAGMQNSLSTEEIVKVCGE